jgi:hypothetical protein
MNWETDEEIKTRIEEQYKDLPDGLYQIGSGLDGGFCAMTGRRGYIEFEISLALHARDMFFNIVPEPKEAVSKPYPECTPLTMEILDEFIKDLENFNKKNYGF